MGLPSTGTKAELEAIIFNRLRSRLAPFNGGRVISVDMGIRNLAFCVLDVPRLDLGQQLGKRPFPSPFTVSHWQKMDLLSTTKSQPADESETHVAADQIEREVAHGKRKRKPTITNSVSKTAFTPSVLSKTASEVARDILSRKPTAILIERQRFRSGGGAAIQEWTVRVNMLESMLWACFQTMRETANTDADDFPTLHEVSPARVANFWTAAPEMNLRPADDLFTRDKAAAPLAKLMRKKVQKKDKIAIVRSWLGSSNVDNKDVPLALAGDAAKTAEVFRARNKKSSRKADAVEDGVVGKLDDLADCMLQAVTWVRWEENSRRIDRLLNEEMRVAFYGSLEASKDHYEGEYF